SRARGSTARSTTSRPRRSSGLLSVHGQLAAEAAAHEFLAVVALHLLVGGLLVAVLHAVLLRRALLLALQAGAHELLARVAFQLLQAGALVARLHPFLLLLLRRRGLLLLLRVGGQGEQRKGKHRDQRSHFSSSSFSIAATSFGSSGATLVSKLCTFFPPRSTRYLWKFHFGRWPVALARSLYSGFFIRSVLANIGKSIAYWLTQNCEISLFEPGSWPPKSFIGKPSTTSPRALYLRCSASRPSYCGV